MTSAVVVVHKDDDSLRAFFNQSVAADKIIEIQNKVKNNEDLDGNIVKNAYEIRLRLTKRGMLLANDVFVEFI